MRKGGKILFLHRQKYNQEYFILLGSGVESEETVKQAVIREAKEELGANVRIIKEFACFKNRGRVEHYFEVETGDKLNVAGDQNLYDFVKDSPLWIPMCQVMNYKILPVKLKLVLEKYLSGGKM